MLCHSRWVLGSVLLAAGAVACSGGGTPSSPGPSSSNAIGSGGPPSPCSPLAGEDVPIALQNVVSAGRDTDGTIYVLDKGTPDFRAFVLEGGVLQRKKVDGSGTMGNTTIVATVSDANAPFTLKVEKANGAVTRMGIHRGTLDAKDFDIAAEGELLALLQPSDYTSLAVRNVTPNVVVEYDATTPDGHRMVVLRPDLDWSYEDFRVFYGTPDAMIERPVRDVARMRDGGSTTIDFTVDGATCEARFPSALGQTGAAAKLTIGGAEQELTVRTADEGPLGAGLSYLCL
jgi:hypothetical protein